MERFESRRLIYLFIYFKTLSINLISVYIITGNNLNLLESKSKTENPVVGERAKTLFPFMVFITQERCPIFTGSMLTPKHVLTIAKYVDDINTRPKSFRVQFNNITAFSIKQAFKDDRYNKSDTFCPFNVGIIEVSLRIYVYVFENFEFMIK